MPKNLARAHVDAPRDLVASRTHVVGGTGQGAILAYERDRSQCIWSARYGSAAHRPGGVGVTHREAEAGLLPFDVLSVDDGAIFHCRTRDPTKASFFLKIDGGVAMAVAAVEEGDKLLKCFRRWFPVVPSPRFGRADRVVGPILFEGLERQDGDWVHATWSAESEDDVELSVYVSIAERMGYFEEKEDHGRRAILALIAALVDRIRG